MEAGPPIDPHGKHRRILPEVKDQKQRSGGPMLRIVDPSKIESLMREILNRLGLSGTQRMMSCWLQGCHPYKNDDFPWTKSRVPDYWPPGCRYVSPTKMNALESQIVSLHLLRAGLQFRDAQFSIERMEESTVNVISGYPRDFYHDAPILINSLYEARRQEIRWSLRGIPSTATHVSAEILMPVPNSRKRTSIKKAIQFDLQLPDDIEGYIGQITSRESSSVAPSAPELCSESKLYGEGAKASAIEVTAYDRNDCRKSQPVEAERRPQDPFTKDQQFSRSPILDSTNTARASALPLCDAKPAFSPANTSFPDFGTRAISTNSHTVFDIPQNTVYPLNEIDTPQGQSTTFQSGIPSIPWDVKAEERVHSPNTRLMQPDNHRIGNVYVKGYNAESQTSGSYSMDFVAAAAPYAPTERAICAFCHSEIGERGSAKSRTSLPRQELPQAAFQNSRLNAGPHVAVPLQTWSTEAGQSSRSVEEMTEIW